MSNINLQLKPIQPKPKKKKCLLCKKVLPENGWEFCDSCESDLSYEWILSSLSKKTQKKNAIAHSSNVMEMTRQITKHQKENPSPKKIVIKKPKKKKKTNNNLNVFFK